ncbi:HlyD family type I secretion periplasmic adaptor subunit [Mesorhizobium sp. BAC0120]|uniref:HlyD family type I secretion periplasmic adaptor subunit n=1 Tax=Mesorhizobium sp. BAC0120 TaxID=3090670 RepID=UPI00298C0A2B|nr:HlyD family type I secretion periplasmic adaptor subunit [Mesorhizobium sp. BAC0120]MDW6021559.1 HlyD family type I secretion periplasmic adaptor subunit [Mesorhizobium sp. BAC0120]
MARELIPPALRSIQRYMIAGMVIFAVATFGIGGWAATSQLSGAVIGEGVVVVDSSVKKVQHATGGIVGELRVREGDHVNAGDILIRLDETQTRANATIITQSLDELLAREARLEAERDSAEQIVFPAALIERSHDDASEAAHAITAERALFKLRQEARTGQKAQLSERVTQLQDEIKGYTGQIDAKQKETDLIHKELEGVRALWQKNLISIERLTSLEREAARLEGERGQLMATIAQSKGKISETQLQIIQIDQDLRAEVGKDLIETRSKLSELSEQKTAAVDQLNRIDIRAPQSGRVHELSVHTVGGVIAPGEQIMLIVPDADALTIEAKIATRDIDQIYAGQIATMRFPAFNQKTTPEVEGSVNMVSADLTQDQRTGVSYYTVRLAPKPGDLAKLGSSKLVPGMPAEVFIKTSARTAMSYLLKPLMDQAERAFRED